MSTHTKLREMADRKANMVISINTVVISVILSAYVRKIDTPAHLTISSVLLLVICLTTILVSLIATNPTISSQKKQLSNPSTPAVDLGYYSQLTANEYSHNVRQLLTSAEAIYQPD